MKKISKLQFITNAKDCKTICLQVNEAIEAGVDWVQFRMKDTSYEERLSVAQKVKEICVQNNVSFIINDDVRLTKEIQADGVHLGLDDMNPIKAREILGEDAIIGATCNTFSHIQERHKQRVDYIGLGPFRFTTTKKNLSPLLGLDGYSTILQDMKKNGIDTPIIAIGGIQEDDITDIANTSVYGIAVSSLITSSDNKKNIINQIHNAI